MSQMRDGEMAIGEVAERTGLPTATINFYVKEGVIPPPRKLNRTRAAYEERHVRWLTVVRRAVNAGMGLSEVKRFVDFYGSGPDGLEKLEGVGSLHPAERPWNDPDRQPIEHFEAEDRPTFAKRMEVEEDLLHTLEEWGVLRPVKGRYRLDDAWLVLQVKSLLREGIPLEKLEWMKELPEVVRPQSELIALLRVNHVAELLSREVRFRDLIEPFGKIYSYLLATMHHELDPGWRDARRVQKLQQHIEAARAASTTKKKRAKKAKRTAANRPKAAPAKKRAKKKPATKRRSSR